MKPLFLIPLLVSLFFTSLEAQEYSQLMQGLKEKMQNQSTYEISVEQRIYYDGVEAQKERMQTRTLGQNGRLFAETAQFKMLQNENSYLLIQEAQEVIYFKRLEEALNPETSMAANFQEWEKTLNQYVENADSIVLLPDPKAHLFVIYRSEGTGVKARVKFDKQSEMLTWMDVIYTAYNGEEIRTSVDYQYDFSPKFAADIFDENNFLTFVNGQAKGKSRYRDFQVICQ